MMDKGKWKILAILFVLVTIGSCVGIINSLPLTFNEALRNPIQSNPIQSNPIQMRNYELRIKSGMVK